MCGLFISRKKKELFFLPLFFIKMHLKEYLTLCLLTANFASGDNLWEQFRPRSGPTECGAWSESKLFDPLMSKLLFLKKYFEKK